MGGGELSRREDQRLPRRTSAESPVVRRRTSRRYDGQSSVPFRGGRRERSPGGSPPRHTRRRAIGRDVEDSRGLTARELGNTPKTKTPGSESFRPRRVREEYGRTRIPTSIGNHPWSPFSAARLASGCHLNIFVARSSSSVTRMPPGPFHRRRRNAVVRTQSRLPCPKAPRGPALPVASRPV